MKKFAALYQELEQTTRSSEKEDALVAYFQQAAPADAAWALYFLMGNRLKRSIKTMQLREWVAEAAGIPGWMLEECYDHVGDLAETLSLLLPEVVNSENILLHKVVEEHIQKLAASSDEERKKIVIGILSRLGTNERFVFLKLLTGNFRIGVAEKLVIRAISELSKIEETKIAHRLSGHWQPTAEFFGALVSAGDLEEDISKPYPFYLAYPLEDELETLGSPEEWQIEWKWDGIRAQLIHRKGEIFLWSRGEELITDRFPEISKAALQVPMGTVLDGEILAWADAEAETPSTFALLQKRIGRKALGAKILSEAPATFLAYDILECDGVDIRAESMAERRKKLEEKMKNLTPDFAALRLSPLVVGKTWEDFQTSFSEARTRRVEGFMLKRKNSAYGVGRRRGDWWKLKSNPYQIDAVLVYAQQGHGRRAGLYTDYTFGIWKEGKLVPFAKAYSGLTDEEIREVDAFIRKNTLDRFGPVRVVAPKLVFELAFEGIQASSRHKSGIAVRFPRISRWRQDKPAEEADSLETVMALLNTPTHTPEKESE